MTEERELTSDELDAVSGGRSVLDAVIAGGTGAVWVACVCMALDFELGVGRRA